MAAMMMQPEADEILRAARKRNFLVHRDDQGRNAYSHLETALNAAGTDLTGAGAEALLPDRRPRGAFVTLLTAMTLVRDVGVFAPIAYTWWELHEVLPAYRGSVGGTSFFAGWAAGAFSHGKNVVQVTPLGHVALVIVSLILCITVLTLLASALDSAVERSCDLGGPRRRLAARLALRTSGTVRTGPAGSARAESAAMPAQVRELGETFTAGVRTLQERLSTLDSSLRNAAEADPRAEFAKSLKTWIDTAESLRRATDTLSVPAEALREFLGGQQKITESQQRLNHQINALITQLAGETKAMAEAAHLQRGVLSDLAKAMQQLGDTLSMFEHRVGTLRGGLDGALRADLRDDRSGYASPETHYAQPYAETRTDNGSGTGNNGYPGPDGTAGWGIGSRTSEAAGPSPVAADPAAARSADPDSAPVIPATRAAGGGRSDGLLDHEQSLLYDDDEDGPR